MVNTKDIDAHYLSLCHTYPAMRNIFPIINQDEEGNDIRRSLKNTLLHTFTSIQQALIARAEGMQRVISAIIKQQIKTVTRPKRPHTEVMTPRKRQQTQTTLTTWCGSTKTPNKQDTGPTRRPNQSIQTQLDCHSPRCTIAVARGQ